MSVAWLVIVLLGFSSSSGNFLEILDENPNDHNLEKSLLSLLVRLHREEPYDILLIYGKDCIFPSLFGSLIAPVVVESSERPIVEWNFSRMALILLCHSAMDMENKIPQLDFRDKLQTNRRLILIKEDTDPEEICELKAEKEQHNVAMVRPDLFQTNIVYCCREFHDPYVHEIHLLGSEPVYIEIFSDMQGDEMIIMGSEVPPASMPYVDPKSGEKKMKGYCANVVTNFAQRVNATLEVLSLGHKFQFTDIAIRLAEGYLDFAIIETSPKTGSDFNIASYPFLVTKYCMMMPLPEKIPHNIIYVIILDRLVVGIIFVMFVLLSILIIYSRTKSWQDLSLANILVNDAGMRGLLGQSFPFPANSNRHMKLIFFILCFASIIITTMYTAYLNALFTHPPYIPLIQTFEDLKKSNQKIAITMDDIRFLTARENVIFLKISKDNLQILESLEEFIRIRDTFNTSYGYLVSENRWSIYEEQQKTFKEPLFYFATDLCFYRTIFTSIPMRRDLPYRHIFENHILSQHEFGLVDYWIRRSYSEMVKLDLVPHKNLSPSRDVNASIELNDISGILTLYVSAMVVSILCFFLEICIKRKSCFRLWKWRKSRT